MPTLKDNELIQYVNAQGWWTALVRREWRDDVNDGPNTSVGTVLGSVTYGDWVPVVMWKIDGEDHTSAVPLIVEDGNRFVEMSMKYSGRRELFYLVEYSPQGVPPKKQGRDIIKGH